MMIPKRWSTLLLLSTLAVAVSGVPLAGQELPREVARRTVAVGTYGGTMGGRAPARFVAGSQIDEELSCDVELRLSSLFLWVTPSGLVQNAQWQGELGPDFVGQVETEMQNRVGQDRWQRVHYNSRNVTVYCYPQVLWRGQNRQGYGLPLRGTYRGPDSYGKREWVTINASWNLDPIRGR